MSERYPLVIVGREVGTISGWDEGGDVTEFIFYDFVPREGVGIPASSSITVNYDDGRIYTYPTDDGEHQLELDIVEVVSDLARREEP